MAPQLPPLWIVDRAVLYRESDSEDSHRQCGRGFFTKVPAGTLPGSFERLLIHLALLNNVMSSHRIEKGKESQTFAIFDTRNALQHQLLSCVRWEQLDEAAKQACEHRIYHCCWLATVIYSNAVLYAVPPHGGWHSKLSDRLRGMLILSDYDSWPDSLDDLLLWILFIGGMAALKTPHRFFYIDALRSLLERKSITHWSAVLDKLIEFLWSDKACARGASMLWPSLFGL